MNKKKIAAMFLAATMLPVNVLASEMTRDVELLQNLGIISKIVDEDTDYDDYIISTTAKPVNVKEKLDYEKVDVSDEISQVVGYIFAWASALPSDY